MIHLSFNIIISSPTPPETSGGKDFEPQPHSPTIKKNNACVV